MLIPCSPSTVKTLAATPGWLRMPAPTIETLPICSSVRDLARARLAERLERLARGRAGRRAATVNDMSAARAVGDRLVLDDHVDVDVRLGERGEDPRRRRRARRGTPASVTRASSVEWVTAVTSGCSMVSLLRDDERTGAVLESWSGSGSRTPWLRAYSTERSCSTPAPEARHLEHLLERDDGELARVGDDPRVGAEDAGDVGVDLADVGAERGGERDRGRVGAAAAERGHVPGVGRDALEAGDEHDLVLVERLLDAVGAHVEDPRLGVRGVGDDPGLRAGQRDRLVAQVVDRHRAERAGDPLAGREQHVHLARVGARRRSRRPSAISSSVVLPRALRHRDDAVALLARGDDPARGALEVLGVGDRGAAELHDDRAQAHASGEGYEGAGAGSDRAPAEHRAAERDLVGVLEVGADRQAAREAGDGDVRASARAARRRCAARSPRRSSSGSSRARPR